MDVRRAAEADADAVADVLAAAFHDYAWTRWTVDAKDHHRRVAALQRLAFVELTLPFGEAWVAVDEDRIVSAAMWMRPDRPVPEERWHALEPLQAELEGDRHAESRRAEAVLTPLRPTAPHYFLGAVGTAPSHQRRGLGRAVLAPVLDRLESEGALACLETCGRDNVAFYERLGFTVTAELAVAPDGPTVALLSSRR